MLTSALVQAVPVALGLLVAAAPTVVLAIVLAGKRPAAVSSAFLAGWVSGLLVAGVVLVALADVVSPLGEPGRWLAVAKVVLGVLLVVVALRTWSSRPGPDDEPSVPGWMAVADTVGSGRAFALGFGLAALNPKNLALVATGATTIADATPLVLEQLVALVVFALVASLGVAAPSLVRLALRERADAVLGRADRWMTRHNATITAGVLLVLGIVVVGNGITSW